MKFQPDEYRRSSFEVLQGDGRILRNNTSKISIANFSSIIFDHLTFKFTHFTVTVYTTNNRSKSTSIKQPS